MFNPLNISDIDVLAILPKLLNAPASDIQLGEWSCQPLKLGASLGIGGVGLMRVSGKATVQGIDQPWTSIVKATHYASMVDADK